MCVKVNLGAHLYNLKKLCLLYRLNICAFDGTGAYAESHESDPAEISDGFKELEEFLCTFPLEDNNAVFNLCCRLCSAYERKAFIDGLQYGAYLISELHE